MFYVTSIDDSKVEPLINIGTDFKMEQSVDGTCTVSFSCFPSENNAGYHLLTPESIVTVQGNHFRVKVLNDNVHSKTVTALSIFYDHLKTYRHGTFNGSHTLENHLNFTLVGTGWTFAVDGSIANVTNYIRSFGDDNVVRLVQKICKAHECEFEILPNKKLHFAKEIGGNNDYQYRYKHNISSIVLQEDTTNLATYIKGFGKDGLTIEYTSPNATIFGIREETPVKDERFTDAAALLNYAKSKLQDEPQLAIETTLPELVSKANGERVWLIYEPLDIEMSTRILKQTKVLHDNELITSSVIFGNSLPKSIEDTIADQEEKIGDNKEELIEKIEEAEGEFRSSITHTNNRITMEVEQLNTSIAAIDIKADNINLSVNNRITQEMAQINIKADNINASVNNRITNEIAQVDIRANQIELSVSNLANNTYSSITQLSNNINLKVDKGGSITDINITPGVVRINANKLDLTGSLMVNGTITGATTIDVSTDINLGRMIRFNDLTAISTGGGSMLLDAFNNISYQASRHYFYGTVDFSNATVVGIPK